MQLAPLGTLIRCPPMLHVNGLLPKRCWDSATKSGSQQSTVPHLLVTWIAGWTTRAQGRPTQPPGAARARAGACAEAGSLKAKLTRHMRLQGAPGSADMASGAGFLMFPAELTPRQRAVLHGVAEAHSLQHESTGEAAERRLTISKPDRAQQQVPAALLWRAGLQNASSHANVAGGASASREPLGCASASAAAGALSH